MIVLTDNEFMEGILGGLASIAAIHFFQKEEKKTGNLLILLIISWAIFWYIRKIGINLYKAEKKERKIKDKHLSLNVGDWGKSIRTLIIIAGGLFIWFGLVKGNGPNLNKILRISLRDIILIAFMFLIGGLIYFNP
tara:strand:- start:834 stop:1241 length:408 start_codon:yes stop_codon:yes gene_type:complete